MKIKQFLLLGLVATAFIGCGSNPTTPVPEVWDFNGKPVWYYPKESNYRSTVISRDDPDKKSGYYFRRWGPGSYGYK